MTKIYKNINIDSTDFLQKGEELGYGWNETNDENDSYRQQAKEFVGNNKIF